MKTVHRLLLGFLLPILCCLLPLRAETGKPAEDFAVRAFYLDFRTQVMTVDAICELATDLSRQGINTLVIEYEATFPFSLHATLCNPLAFSRSDVQTLVSHCASVGIDVIPLQNCFGHSEYILRHERYAHLREDAKEVSQVCPLRIEAARKVFREIFGEVARLHPSPYFHIGADETYLLGSCPRCAQVEKSRLFVDYVKAMCQVVKELGKQPIIWADIILQHPEALDELPDDLIYVDWNYGWEPDRFGKLDNLLKRGARMWGASALRSAPDNLYLTQWMKHFRNLETFLPFARRHGYEGIIQTSWSTSGTYGFHYDNGWEVLSMQPVRQVYPAAGFRILLDAYAQALRQDEGLDVPNFIRSYARTRYLLGEADAETFLDYFLLPQEPLVQGKESHGVPADSLARRCELLRERFARLTPRQGKEDFRHYRLMLDLRLNYLRYKAVESGFNTPDLAPSDLPTLCKRLQQVVKDSEKADKRFVRLMRGYLKPGQAEAMNQLRNEKMLELYATLQRACGNREK